MNDRQAAACTEGSQRVSDNALVAALGAEPWLVAVWEQVLVKANVYLHTVSHPSLDAACRAEWCAKHMRIKSLAEGRGSRGSIVVVGA